MQQRAGGHQPVGPTPPAGGPVQLLGPGAQHQRFEVGMATDPEAEPLGPLEVVGQQAVEVGEGMGQVGAELAHGPFGAPAEAVPHLGQRILRRHEEHERGLRAMGQQQGHGTGFIAAGQVPEVAVLTEGEINVGVVPLQHRRRDDRRQAPQGLKETAAAVVERDRHGLCRFHPEAV